MLHSAIRFIVMSRNHDLSGQDAVGQLSAEAGPGRGINSGPRPLRPTQAGQLPSIKVLASKSRHPRLMMALQTLRSALRLPRGLQTCRPHIASSTRHAQSRRSSTAAGLLPLEGYRVLDMTRVLVSTIVLQAPFLTCILENYLGTSFFALEIANTPT